MVKKLLALWSLCILPVYGLANNLIIGSSIADGANSTFEKYDDNGNRLLTGNLSVSRSNHSATLFSNGSIFVAGGDHDSTGWQILDQNGGVLSSGLLNDQRISAAADRLTNGNVFIAGGITVPGTWEIHSPTGALSLVPGFCPQRGPVHPRSYL